MFPDWWTQELYLERVLHEILVDQKIIIQNQKKFKGEIMTALDDTKAAFAQLKALVEAFIAANTGGASDADLAGLTADINALSAEVAPPAPPAVS